MAFYYHINFCGNKFQDDVDKRAGTPPPPKNNNNNPAIIVVAYDTEITLCTMP